MDDIKSMVHTCFYCGNTGILNYIGQTRCNDEAIDYHKNGEIAHREILGYEDWVVFECPVCNKPVIVRQETLSWADYTYRPQIEYPSVAVPPDGVPKEIYSAFESAIRTKGIDYSICLLSLRRVLEMVCKDKNADGGTLEAKIDDLVEKKIFPERINDACWIIRQMGNEAAHADDIKVYTYDIEQVIGYVATIIDYLYSLPYRVEKMKAKIEERKNSNKKEEKK